MDSKLLEILACPRCKQSLTKGKGGSYLICKSEGLAYPIVDGIPQLLESAVIVLAKIDIADAAETPCVSGQ
jgi:hypothetical protein